MDWKFGRICLRSELRKDEVKVEVAGGMWGLNLQNYIYILNPNPILVVYLYI
jgi:hypothetical protein